MKITTSIVAASIALVAASPSLAGGLFHRGGGSTSSGDPTSVPEPSDAVLVLMGAAGVIIGRHLHARAKRKG